MLEAHGVCKIYSVEDGRRLGLVGMIKHMLETTRRLRCERTTSRSVAEGTERLGVTLTLVEQKKAPTVTLGDKPAPVLGITGVGGAEIIVN